MGASTRNKYCFKHKSTKVLLTEFHIRLLSHSQALNTKVQKYKNIALSHSQAVETNPSFYYCFISYLCE